MFKIISEKKYNELLNIKTSYEEIIGQRWYILSGGRSQYSRLMQLSKESLINLVMEMRSDIRRINKKLNKNYKCRVEMENHETSN